MYQLHTSQLLCKPTASRPDQLCFLTVLGSSRYTTSGLPMKLIATDRRRFIPPLYCLACLSPTLLFHRFTLRRLDSTALVRAAPARQRYIVYHVTVRLAIDGHSAAQTYNARTRSNSTKKSGTCMTTERHVYNAANQTSTQHSISSQVHSA